MTKRDTKQRIIQLRELAQEAGEKMLERFKIAKECLADKDWIAEEHQGDELCAMEWLQSTAFGDLCAFVPLSKLLLVYDTYPDVSAWRKYRFDLRAMIALWEEARAAESKEAVTRRRATIAELTAAEQRATQAEATTQHVREQLTAKDQEIDDLRAIIADLERKLAKSEGELEVLRRLQRLAA